MTYKYLNGNYFLIIDLPDSLVISRNLPIIDEKIDIYWAPNDRYLCFVGRDKGDIVIYETAMGDFQKINLKHQIYGNIMDVLKKENYLLRSSLLNRVKNSMSSPPISTILCFAVLRSSSIKKTTGFIDSSL